MDVLIHIRRQDIVSDVIMITKSASKIVQGQLDLGSQIKELKILLLLLKSYIFNVQLHRNVLSNSKSLYYTFPCCAQIHPRVRHYKMQCNFKSKKIGWLKSNLSTSAYKEG